MSHKIRSGVNFRSYAAFKAAFDEYCRENAVASVPLKFLRHTFRKLNPKSFTNDQLDRDTINRFVYRNLSLKCEHNESITTNEHGPYCNGCITLLYNRSKNVLHITSFTGHAIHCGAIRDQNANEDARLKEIVKIARQLPTDALDLVEQVCKSVHEKWDQCTAGLTVRVEPIQCERDVISQILHEFQSIEPGMFRYNPAKLKILNGFY